MMSVRNWLIIATMIHAAITAYTLQHAGYFGALPPFPNLATYQVFSDASFSVFIALFFIFREVKSKALSLKHFMACFILTFFFGVFSPLIYLILEPRIYQDER